MSTIMSILDRFEAKAIEAIKIDSKIKCDNYESVCRLKLIDKIRQAIAAAYHTPPQNPQYTLETLLPRGKINL